MSYKKESVVDLDPQRSLFCSAGISGDLKLFFILFVVPFQLYKFVVNT